MQSREHEASEKEAQRENESVINRFKLNVQTNAVCVDILVWVTKDEQGPGTISGKVSYVGKTECRLLKRISYNTFHNFDSITSSVHVR